MLLGDAAHLTPPFAGVSGSSTAVVPWCGPGTSTATSLPVGLPCAQDERVPVVMKSPSPSSKVTAARLVLSVTMAVRTPGTDWSARCTPFTHPLQRMPLMANVARLSAIGVAVNTSV